MKAPVSTAIAILAGVLVLLGYFIPGVFGGVQQLLLQWATALAAFAALAGIYNLVSVHWRKIQNNHPASGYSAVLIITFLLTVVAVAISGATGGAALWVFDHIQFPVAASLMALLAVVLVHGAARLFQRRPTLFTLVFAAAALLALFAAAPFYFTAEPIPALTTLRDLLTDVAAVAGVRGILLGVALGVVAAGIRILMGADRPYGG